MDQKQMAVTAKRMTEARASLVRDYPFFGHLALGLQLACAPCGTACTDGELLIFAPSFAEQLKSGKEMEFVTIHEVLHCVFEHCTRVHGLNQALYNIACDIVVNSTILEMWGIPTFRVAGEEAMHLAPNGREGMEYNAEEIYHMLLKQGKAQNGRSGISRKMQNGTEMHTLDRHDIWQTIGHKERLRDAWDQKIRAAANAYQGTGQMPQSMRKLAEALMRRSDVDWKALLHDFIQYDTYDYSFSPPDRRFSDVPFFLPAYNINEDQGTVHDIWICVDTSGSVDDAQLAQVMAEIQDAMRQTGMTGVISFFDLEITDPEPFDTQEEFRKILPKGGGGTSFHVIFQYLQERLSAEQPRAILVFTDGFAAWPTEDADMGVPVLWLIQEGGNANTPWGSVVHIR